MPRTRSEASVQLGRAWSRPAAPTLARCDEGDPCTCWWSPWHDLGGIDPDWSVANLTRSYPSSLESVHEDALIAWMGRRRDRGATAVGTLLASTAAAFADPVVVVVIGQKTSSSFELFNSVLP